MYPQYAVAPPHFSQQVTDFLQHTYPGHWNGKGRPVAWLPQPLNLNPLDFYLWDHMKSLVYKQKMDNRDALLH
jgi:hypothetical protein